MKKHGNVEISSPVPTESLKSGGGPSGGSVPVVSGAKDQGTKSSSQPNTQGGELVSPAKSK